MEYALEMEEELIDRSITGDHSAFESIVRRYQILITSVAYNYTGDLGASEDIAQETFVAAWKDLGKLRNRNQLRAWLCGIARNLVNNTFRRKKRDPVQQAQELTEVESPYPESSPLEHIISEEEQNMLWTSLKRLPENYRMPLILFYRQSGSIKQVADELQISSATVKQRLTRGRKMLKAEILSFVGSALAKTIPGPSFTQKVVASLSSISSPAMAASLTAASFSSTAQVSRFTALGDAAASRITTAMEYLYGISVETLSTQVRSYILYSSGAGLLYLFIALAAEGVSFFQTPSVEGSSIGRLPITIISMVLFITGLVILFLYSRSQACKLASFSDGKISESYLHTIRWKVMKLLTLCSSIAALISPAVHLWLPAHLSYPLTAVISIIFPLSFYGVLAAMRGECRERLLVNLILAAAAIGALTLVTIHILWGTFLSSASIAALSTPTVLCSVFFLIWNTYMTKRGVL
ncbi:MAG: RNA polymerase sigma factor [Candidatus Xenobiia bacterium LiM19]